MSSPINRQRTASLEKYLYPPLVRRGFDPRGASVLLSTDIRHPSTNKYYDLGTIWHNTVGERFFILEDIIANLGRWCLFTGGGGGGVTSLKADDGNTVNPNLGVIDIDGLAVTNVAHAKPLFTTGAVANIMVLEMAVSTAITGAPGDKLGAGICTFDDTAFAVDVDGYVTLAGGTGPAIDSVAVDANTGPGTDPVLPTGAGLITVAGAAVAGHSVPVESHSRAANTYNIEVQQAVAVTATPADRTAIGLSSFNDVHFSVDATSGMVSLLSGVASDQFVTDDGAPPVLPDGAGEIEIFGGTNITTAGQGAGNTITINASGVGSLVCLEVTENVAAMVPFTIYVVNNAAARTLTLPVSSAFGDMFVVVRKGAGGVSILQNAGDTIHFNIEDTTTGVGGSLVSLNQWDVIWIKTVIANTDFVVLNSSGLWTVN